MSTVVLIIHMLVPIRYVNLVSTKRTAPLELCFLFCSLSLDRNSDGCRRVSHDCRITNEINGDDSGGGKKSARRRKNQTGTTILRAFVDYCSTSAHLLPSRIDRNSTHNASQRIKIERVQSPKWKRRCSQDAKTPHISPFHSFVPNELFIPTVLLFFFIFSLLLTLFTNHQPTSTSKKQTTYRLFLTWGIIIIMVAQHQQQSKSPSCCSILCSCIHSVICWIFSVAVCIAIAVVLYVLLTGDSETIDDILNDPTNILVPSDMPGRNDTLLWRDPTGQGGIQLEVLNALEDQWIPAFEEYIQKWDAGYQNDTHIIDPLSLTVQRVAVDPQCEPVQGKLKACNADYGETDWRGINIALTDQYNYIQNSISKYNDFFINTGGALQSDDNQMRYTMCHELGHGWGLAHTDENYYNINTGECMDYTQFPGRNLNVGEFNLNLLHELYGNVERRLLRQSTVTTTSSVRRQLSEETIAEYRSAIEHVSQDRSCADCTVDLSNGYRVYVHKLLV